MECKIKVWATLSLLTNEKMLQIIKNDDILN